MRRVGLILVIIGLALTFGSCVVFPSQFGSDYAAINAGGLFGTGIGILLDIIGIALLTGGDEGRSSNR